MIASVPDCARYLTLGELEASTDALCDAHTDVRVRTVGTSREGRAIRCLDVGSGAQRAVLVGMPHPEEPVGTLVLEHLLPLLADGLADELGFTVSVVKAADPDGMRLNETWFDRPGDLEAFLLESYRPAFVDQFEWTFPVQYKRYAFTKPLPEARAVMEVLHAAPTDLYMGLHNSNFSGVYFYLSHDDGPLRGELQELLSETGLPPHCGEPEMPYLAVLAPGVFRSFSLIDDYEYFERYGSDPAAVLEGGTSSDAYAERVWDCFTLVAEVPYFTSPRIGDRSPAGITRAQAKLEGLDRHEELCDWLWTRYVQAAPCLTVPSPWQRAVFAYLHGTKETLAAERVQVRAEPGFAAEATVAQAFDSSTLRELDTLEVVGRFANMCAAEPVRHDTLTELCAAARAEVRARAPRLAADGGLVSPPVRTLVQTQVAALLGAMVAVRDRYRAARPRPGAPRIAAP